MLQSSVTAFGQGGTETFEAKFYERYHFDMTNQRYVGRGPHDHNCLSFSHDLHFLLNVNLTDIDYNHKDPTSGV